MSAADFDAKAADCFRTSVRPQRDDLSRRLRSLVNDLDSLDDVRALADLFEPIRMVRRHVFQQPAAANEVRLSSDQGHEMRPSSA